MSGTTLNLDEGEDAPRKSFEVRLPRFVRGARNTPEEDLMSIEQQAKGKLEETKGRAKQAQGDLTGDKSKKGEGVLDEAKGKTRQAGDRVREAANDLKK
jgi:uncharacterized protein YjbJ (UPF0337 family)